MSEARGIIIELEQIPSSELEIACSKAYWDVDVPMDYCWSQAPWWVLNSVIEKVHEHGLFPEFFGCLMHVMGDKAISEICGITPEREKEVSVKGSQFLMGMGLMMQSPRKIVIAALAAKRLHDISPEACVGVTSSHDGTRLQPLITAALDVTVHSTDLDIMEHECPREGE